MTIRPNPFRPGFGNSPPVLAGRDDLVEQFAEALDNGPGAPGRATLYTGARGTGKTVMLNEAADVARQRGWLVIEETASPGVVTRLVTQHLPALLTELDPRAGAHHRQTRSTAPMGVGAIAWDSTDRHVVAAGLRNQLELACDLLAERGHGPAPHARRGPRLAHRRPARRFRRRAAPVPQRPRASPSPPPACRRRSATC